MNLNALTATIKSVLHTSGKYNREMSDTVARQIAQFIVDNQTEVLAEYSGDQFEIAESVARDYLAAL